MSWVTIIWAMTASACLTLAAMHLLVWFKSRASWDGLLYALAAASTACLAFCELWMMRATTPVEFGEALWWTHLPAWAVIVLLVGLVRLHLHAGRRWLAWTVCGVRTLSLLLNFVFTPNLNFREITGLRHIRFLGESITLAEGLRNPWMLVGQLSFLLLVIFVVDAMITVWRREDRPQLRLLSAAIVFFFLLGTGQAVLSLWGAADTPITASLFFMGILIVMGVEMSTGVLRAARLAADLRESEERLSLAAEAAHLGLWVWDVRKDEIWITSQGRALFGLGATERVDRSRFLQAVHFDDREAMQEAVVKSLREDVDYEREYRVPLPEGGIRWVVVRGRVERDATGLAIRVRGVAFDITARKQADLEMQTLRQNLEHAGRVGLLGELSGSLAHELNQPLAAILANAQAARRWLARPQPNLDELRAVIEDIIGDDKRAGEIVHRVRALAKKNPPEGRLLDVNEVVREAAGLLRSELIAAAVPITLELPPGLPAVEAGQVELQQALLNLMLNGLQAQKETRRSRRKLAISTHAADGFVVMSVRDRGPGLSPEVAPRIFDSFFTTKPGGLGLGLALCRRIAESHGGRLTAENHPDGGAVFSLSLPAKEARSG